MAQLVLSGVIRITIHPKIFTMSSGLDEVIGFCDILLDQPHCVFIQPGDRHWDIFKSLCAKTDARGNLAPHVELKEELRIGDEITAPYGEGFWSVFKARERTHILYIRPFVQRGRRAKGQARWDSYLVPDPYPTGG